MASELPIAQLPLIMPTYPHMLAEDTIVWTEFLKQNRTPISGVWYDIHVGGAIQIGDASDIIAQKVASGVSRKRIDVVCKVHGGYWVVEIKPIANMASLGQIITYFRLFVAEYAVQGEVVPIVICFEADQDIISTFEHLEVGLIKVDRPGEQSYSFR